MNVADFLRARIAEDRPLTKRMRLDEAVAGRINGWASLMHRQTNAVITIIQSQDGEDDRHSQLDPATIDWVDQGARRAVRASS